MDAVQQGRQAPATKPDSNPAVPGGRAEGDILKRLLTGLATVGLLGGALPASAALLAAGVPSVPALSGPRDSAPVVLTGKQLPALSAPAPVPVRALYTDAEDRTQVVPPDSSHGANVATGSLAVFAYRDGAFVEVPSQADERFWRFLSNPGGESGELSGFDTELGYVFDTEGFRRTEGLCYAAFRAGQPVTTADPVAGFDDDDELAFMARDAGARAPGGATPVAGRDAYEVAVTDPLTNQQVFAYVVSAPGRAHSFGAGYVSYTRDQYADRYLAARSGEGIPDGTRCSGPDTGVDTGSGPVVESTGARRPRDFATFASDRYSFHFGGRWKPDGLQVAGPDGSYGVDLIDQWKGRAFQQARKQAVSIGFIGEKAWEESSVLLGERSGAIRAIRETWGAKSGTNITRVFTMYDRFLTDTINLRVHPIPPDGVYSMWDHNQGAVSTYYSPMVPDGVPIDGVNDELVGNLDVGVGTPAESHYDVADPTHQPYGAVEQWEEVAGRNGSVVYYTHNPRPSAAVITSYYRDDADFDDGSGEDPAVKQGAFGAHGLHIYATADTDNTPAGVPLDELQVVTSQYPLVGDAGNVGEQYAAVERVPLQVEATLLAGSGEPEPTATPTPTSTPTSGPSSSPTKSPKPAKPVKDKNKDKNGPDAGSGLLVGPASTLPGSDGAQGPSLARTDSGAAYVGADGGRLWRGDGAGFSPLAPTGPVAGLPRTGGQDLAVDAAGYLHAAGASAPGVTVVRSIDDGASFDRGTPVAGLLPTGSPRLAAGRFNSGVEGASLTVSYPSKAGLVVARSIDGGLTFAQQTLASTCTGCSLGPVVVDRANDAAVWLAQSGPDGVAVLRSSDGGVTFSSAPVAGGPVTTAPALSRGATGELVVAWTDAAATRTATSSDGGATWSTPTTVAGPATAVAVAHTAGGLLAVATAGDRAAVSVSRDGGVSFFAPQVLDGVASSGIALAGDSSGRFVAVWATTAGLRTATLG